MDIDLRDRYFTHGSTPGHPALHAFGGLLPGMVFMYVATRLYGAAQVSLSVIGVLVASVVLFVIGYLRYASTPGHPVLQVFGGFLLGMLSMSIATFFYGMPGNSPRAWCPICEVRDQILGTD